MTSEGSARAVPNYGAVAAAKAALESFLQIAKKRNPHRRVGTPDDVARCIVALCHPATYWMTGNVLRVDGGESIVG